MNGWVLVEIYLLELCIFTKNRDPCYQILGAFYVMLLFYMKPPCVPMWGLQQILDLGLWAKSLPIPIYFEHFLSLVIFPFLKLWATPKCVGPVGVKHMF